MVSKEITRSEEHTLSLVVLYFFAGWGSLAAAVSLPTFSLHWSFFPVPPGLGLPLGATDASSDSESSEVAALYSDSSEPASSAAV